MELLTDILAIAGWFALGAVIPTLFKARNHIADIYMPISFGLIAASFVLG